jgi:ABC-type polysaccharide/polyol phosphate export permease
MFKTVVAFLSGLLLFLVHYLRDCTGFECSVTNPIFPISPVIFIARNSITR